MLVCSEASATRSNGTKKSLLYRFVVHRVIHFFSQIVCLPIWEDFAHTKDALCSGFLHIHSH